MDRVTFVGHDLEAFGQVTIDALNHHQVVVVPGKNVAIDLQKGKGFPANAVEFAILVKNDGVAVPIAQLCTHDSQCNVLELACRMGSMEMKPVIPQHATRCTSKPTKLECLPAE